MSVFLFFLWTSCFNPFSSLWCLMHWALLLRLPAGYLVLEGYGGSGESSTDDDLQATGKQLSASRGCGAGDSGISLRFSSASQAGSISSFSRQVLSHLRNLQTNLNHLKVRTHGWVGGMVGWFVTD